MPTAPSIEAARKMGEKGGPTVEAERLAFEAWMSGHCWALEAEWDGTGYRGSDECDGYVCPRALSTRRLWAAWRDRAALQSATDAVSPWISTSVSLPDEGESVAFVVRASHHLAYLSGTVLGGTYRANQYTGGFSVPGLTVDASFYYRLPPPPKVG